MIIPLPIPIPFTLFSLDRKRRKQKWNRKKKKLFWSFWLRFRRASDSASDSDFWFTLDRNTPCASDTDSASDSAASVNQPLPNTQYRVNHVEILISWETRQGVITYFWVVLYIKLQSCLMYEMLSLRYVLLKERNMLNTLRHEAKRQGVPMPSPQRCYKVTIKSSHEK